MAKPLNVNIDLSDVAREFMLGKYETDAMAKKVLNDLTLLILRNIQAGAGKELFSTRQEYLSNLRLIEKGHLTNAIVLMGKFPNMLENGASPFDIKNGFAKSRKVKISKEGKWYLHVPFRWATPQAIGENAVFSGVLPKEVYKAIRATVSPTKTNKGGSKQYGGGLKSINIPEEHSSIGKREAIVDSSGKILHEEYHHKSSIYEGIQRSSKTYEKATQGQYVSFRTAGENSDPNSWLHRGLRQYNFFGKALNGTNVNNQVENSIDEFLSARGF